jgi:hypothetical protein
MDRLRNRYFSPSTDLPSRLHWCPYPLPLDFCPASGSLRKRKLKSLSIYHYTICDLFGDTPKVDHEGKRPLAAPKVPATLRRGIDTQFVAINKKKRFEFCPWRYLAELNTKIRKRFL